MMLAKLELVTSLVQCGSVYSIFSKMFGTMHFNINRLIVTKVDSTYLGY